MKEKRIFKVIATSSTLLGLFALAGCEPPGRTVVPHSHDVIIEQEDTMHSIDRDPTPEVDERRPRPSIDIDVGGEDGVDINIDGNKADPTAGAIDVEVGDGKGVQVDVERKQDGE